MASESRVRRFAIPIAASTGTIAPVLALTIAEALEQGKVAGWWGDSLSRVWQCTLGRNVVRRLAWPSNVRVIAVGGATLGGSGKTPLAIACAIELANAGARATVVGHGYRGRLDEARVVGPFDSVECVGDEALVAARALDGCDRARVVVAPTRAAAIQMAARSSDVLVLDGVSQTRPVRATMALLAVDGTEPWGRAAALPPRGDLRAPIADLLRACDVVVPLTDAAALPRRASLPPGGPTRETERAPAGGGGGGGSGPLGSRLCPSGGIGGSGPGQRIMPATVMPATVEADGAWTMGSDRVSRRHFFPWASLRNARVGLLLALARPDRIVRWLVRRGVSPCAIVRAPNHGPVDRRLERACRSTARGEIDVWLATQKCAAHAYHARLGAPLAVMDHSLALHPAFRSRLRKEALP